MTSALALLGPQRHDPIVGRVVRDLGIDGTIATINAGWQEREPDDDELDSLLEGRSRNLHLYGRWLDVAEREPAFVAADVRRRETVEEVQAVYLIRLNHALQSLAELQVRTGDQAVLDSAVEDTIRSVSQLDAWHLERVAEVNASFAQRWPVAEHPPIARHRAEVARILDEGAGVAVAGGHVAVLLQVLRLFDVASHLVSLPVVAWSAGAMALTDTVVLFHDFAVHGSRQAEVYDRGLGLAPGIVALPHPRRRLDLGDAGRMRVLTRRFAPARCLLLDDGIEVRLGPDRTLPAGSPVVTEKGEVPVDGA